MKFIKVLDYKGCFASYKPLNNKTLNNKRINLTLLRKDLSIFKRFSKDLINNLRC